MKFQAGWIKSWNQDCQEKYQQPQVCRWYHSNGTKWRETKESLDEDEKRRVKKLAWNWTLKKLRSWHPIPLLHGKQIRKKWKLWQTLFSWAPKSLWTVTAATKLKETCSLEKKQDKPRQHIEKQKHYFTNKGPSSESYSFSKSHAQIWELDYKKGWVLKNWCFWTVVLEKTLESLLDCKEIQPVNPKGNQPWIFTGRTDGEAEAPILWPPDVKSRLTGKDPDGDAGKNWRQMEKGQQHMWDG